MLLPLISQKYFCCSKPLTVVSSSLPVIKTQQLFSYLPPPKYKRNLSSTQIHRYIAVLLGKNIGIRFDLFVETLTEREQDLLYNKCQPKCSGQFNTFQKTALCSLNLAVSGVTESASFFTSDVLGYRLPFKHDLIHSLFVKFHVVIPMSSGVVGKGIAW